MMEDSLAHNRANDRVEPRAVTATSENADPHGSFYHGTGNFGIGYLAESTENGKARIAVARAVYAAAMSVWLKSVPLNRSGSPEALASA
jgi:hypothetical protein